VLSVHLPSQPKLALTHSSLPGSVEYPVSDDIGNIHEVIGVSVGDAPNGVTPNGVTPNVDAPDVNVDDGGRSVGVGSEAQQDKGYLALGELLDLLRPEFPELTVSKIRFLEQQGLLSPERTPSGYRKFFPSHAARLRWILVQQEGTYLPLREIKARLSSAESEGLFAAEDRLSPVPSERVAQVTPLIREGSSRRAPAGLRAADVDPDERGDDEGAEDQAGNGSLRGAPVAALGERRHPAGLARRAATAFASMSGPEGSEAHPSARPSASTIARAAAAAGVVEGSYRDGRGSPDTPDSSAGDSSRFVPSPDSQDLIDDPSRRGNLRSVPAGTDLDNPNKSGDEEHARSEDNVLALRPELQASNADVSTDRQAGLGASALASSKSRFTFAELAAAANMTAEELRQIEQFGLIVGRPVAGTVYFDDDALAAAQLAKSFQAFGVEPRHLRIFRTAVDREADFYAQVVSPLVYRREERSRQQALANLAELHQLGARLRDVTLRQVLRTTFDLG
jgi:DNA-binding transcriptional MerR regulator